MPYLIKGWSSDVSLDDRKKVASISPFLFDCVIHNAWTRKKHEHALIIADGMANTKHTHLSLALLAIKLK